MQARRGLKGVDHKDTGNFVCSLHAVIAGDLSHLHASKTNKKKRIVFFTDSESTILFLIRKNYN